MLLSQEVPPVSEDEPPPFSDSLSIIGSVALLSPQVFSREFIYASSRDVRLLGMGVGTCWEDEESSNVI